jgi:hypothetical protein
MSRIPALNPVDVAVALALVEAPGSTYQQLGDMLVISPSTSHQSVARLREAGLVRAGTQEIVRPSMLEFLEHGLRYAFPARLLPATRGVPTSHAGPALSQFFAADEAIVWPSIRGLSSGPAITPLYEDAVELPERSPGIYWMLTLADALRVGRLRERKEAITLLRARFYQTAVVAA